MNDEPERIQGGAGSGPYRKPEPQQPMYKTIALPPEITTRVRLYEWLETKFSPSGHEFTVAFQRLSQNLPLR